MPANHITALNAGMAIGARSAEFEREYQLAQERLALAQQEYGRRDRDDRQRAAEFEQRRAAYEQQKAAQDAQDAADTQAQTGEYGRLAIQPGLLETASGTDWETGGQDVLAAMGQAGRQRDAFAATSPDAQRAMLATPRKLESERLMAELERKFADEEAQRKLAALYSSGIQNTNPAMFRKFKTQIAMGHQTAIGEMPMSESDYAGSPAFAELAPEHREQAMSVFRNTGKPPGPEWRGRISASNPTQDPVKRSNLRAQILDRSYRMALQGAEHAAKRLADFDKANGGEPAPPVDDNGNQLPPTDPRWGPVNTLIRKRKPLMDAHTRAMQQLQKAEAEAMRAKDQALGIVPPPLEETDPEEAARIQEASDIVLEQNPELDPENPAHAKILRQKVAELLGTPPG